MCDYQGHEFGGQYLDSVCIDGYLWDADSGDFSGEEGWEYTNGGDIPCPQCNHLEWLEYQHDDIEERGWIAADDMLPRDPPFRLETLRYPSDMETLKKWWFDGFDKRISEMAACKATRTTFTHES